MWGIIKLIRDNPTAVHSVHFCHCFHPSHKLLTCFLDCLSLSGIGLHLSLVWLLAVLPTLSAAISVSSDSGSISFCTAAIHLESELSLCWMVAMLYIFVSIRLVWSCKPIFPISVGRPALNKFILKKFIRFTMVCLFYFLMVCIVMPWLRPS